MRSPARLLATSCGGKPGKPVVERPARAKRASPFADTRAAQRVDYLKRGSARPKGASPFAVTRASRL